MRGPCSRRVTIEEHKSIVVDFASLHGRQRLASIIGELAARDEGRRRRAGLRERREATATSIAALETVLAKSAVVLADDVDADLFGIAHDELAAAVQQFVVRGGRIRGVRSWVVDKELDSRARRTRRVGARRTPTTMPTPPPREIIVPALPDDAAELELWLAAMRPRRARQGVAARRPARRQGRAAADRDAQRQAGAHALQDPPQRRLTSPARRRSTDIQEALGMDEAPLRMECYDVSHLGGTNIVASMVVFEDGLPRKRPVPPVQHPRVDRRHRVDLPGADAAGSRTSTTTTRRSADEDRGRRRGRDQAQARSPTGRNLLIVDGGQPQVAGRRSARSTTPGSPDIPLCGIAKRLEEIWLPGLRLSRSSCRATARRCSCSSASATRPTASRSRYQRQQRKTRHRVACSPRSPASGRPACKELLRHFGSVDAAASRPTPSEIAEVRGIGPALAAAIVARLRA